jgi:predicted RNA binding protein YcfA (HicA-like mRNA interferase family)
MSINYSRLHNLSARALISALMRDGFILDRQAGAHQHYMHPDGRRVTVSFHRPGETFEAKALKAMIEVQAGWTEEDLRRLKLMK